MAAEIDEQPAAVERVLTTGADPIAQVAAEVGPGTRTVLLAGRGTSGHAALYAKSLVETIWGLPCGLISPSMLTIFDGRPRLADTLVIAVSQSGRTVELADCLNRAQEQGARTVAITNHADSPVAKAGKRHLDLLAGPERSHAATKTYLTELATLYLLINQLAGRDVRAQTGGLPDAIAATLAGTGERLAARAARFRAASRMVIIGRGYSHASAREAALKIMETSYVFAAGLSSEDLMHGPSAILGSEVPVLGLTTGPLGAAAMTAALERVRVMGSDLTTVGPDGDLPVVVGNLEEALTPLLDILPVQRLAWQMAVDRGIDPDVAREKQTRPALVVS
jgi:glucosamine--fructose-6-phosphate aminotransferase (isomerizing)